MVSSAISGISQKSVSAVSSISGRQNSQDSFETDFSKVMNASLQNRNSGKTASFGVSGNTVRETTSVKTDSSTVKQDAVTVDNNSKTTTAVNEDNFKEDVAQAVSDIKDKIKETMNVSEEDIENAMEQLGIGIIDLLDPQSVTDLVVALSGNSDSLEFLTDASAVASLEDIINTVNEVTQNLTETYNIDMTSFKDIVKDFENVSDEAVVSEQPTDKEITDYQDDKQNEKTVTEDTKESITDVIAEKTEVKSEAFADEKKNDSDTHLQDKNNDGIEKITSDMTQSIQKAFSEVVDETSAVNEVDIVRQVVEQIKVTATQQLSSIEVMLNPENLGKVHVAVTAKQGIVTAQLTAQNEQVKAALENQMTALKEQFNNQGVKVEAVEITVQSHGFESEQNLEGNNSNQAQQEKKSHRKLDLSSLEGLDESDMTSEEIRAKDAIVNGNSSVEYSA